MSKIIRIVFAVLFVLVMGMTLTACSCNHEYDEGTVVKEATCAEEGVKLFTCTLCGEEKEESIPLTEHQYEEAVTKEATFDAPGEITFTCAVCKDSYTEEIPVKERTVVVTVTDKRNIPEDVMNGQYSDRVELTFNLENQSDKEVKGVSGILTVNDLFGNKILSTNCDFTGQAVAAGSTATISGLGMDINPFISEHTKFYNEDFADLNFVYEVSNIVYSGESASEQQGQSDNSPVSVKVVGKENVEADIYNGIYSPRVQFVIEVTNNSDKDIKGVSGVLTINDLFGKEILSTNCDFTGQVIASGATTTYSGLGMDINEFIDEHVKLYNENFDDLSFEYEVSSIVYNDGQTESF